MPRTSPPPDNTHNPDMIRTTLRSSLPRALALIAGLGLLSSLFLSSCGKKDEIKPTKNLIVMITDGTSTGLLSTARWYKQYLNPSEDLSSLAIDPYICGLVRTHNSDAPIAESSGSMSDYMTGILQQGRNISVYPHSNAPYDLVPIDQSREFQPQTTLAEAGRLQQGKSVGVVATCVFYHATPAATSAHTVERGATHDIARQMASQGLDVLFAGGAKAVDDEVKEILSDEGITYIEKDVDAFRSHTDGKVWALFNNDNMLYEIDRDDSEPSLTEMTTKALELLSRNPKGFFLMVEGSKVDMAAHSKDAVGTVTEFIEFNNAVQAVLDFARKDGNTTVVIMPDHGTGGITMGDANYANYTKQPLDSMFLNFSKYKASGVRMEQLISQCAPEDVKKVFKEYTDIDLSPRELAALLSHRGVTTQDYMNAAHERSLSQEINRIMTSHTHIAFISGNHTGEDVFLAVYNPNGQRPEGLVRNIHLNRYMRKAFGLKKELEVQTDEIYVPQYQLFEGYDWTVAQGKYDPQLVVRSGGKILVVPANRSFYYVGDDNTGGKDDAIDLSTLTRKNLASVACWIRENNNFYMPAALRNELPAPAHVQHGDIPVFAWSGIPKDATKESLTKTYSEWKEHGVTGLCINGGMDIEKIKMASEAAHGLGLEYHAWTPVMTQGGMPHSWYAVSREGKSADTDPAFVSYYTFLDPHNPNVRKWAKEILTEIALIPTVDYVQLDYIRYPDVILARGLWNKYGLDMHEEYPAADYCYCPDCVADFKALTGIDITKVRHPERIAKWAQFRCDNVTGMVKEIADEVHSKGGKISADVFPGPRSHAVPMVRQEWDKWPLDKVFPMNYNDFYLADVNWVGKVTREEVRSIPGVPVYSGLFICKEWRRKVELKDPEQSGLVPDEIGEAVIQSMKAGAEGICLFTPEDMTPEHWEALDKARQQWKNM